MSEQTLQKANYGNWVSTQLLLVSGVLCLIFTGLAFLLPWLGIIVAFFFLWLIYFAYARYMFSLQGGDIQTKVKNLLLERTKDWAGTGKALDIGCGNGPVTILIA
jgi:hypothetical protein